MERPTNSRRSSMTSYHSTTSMASSIRTTATTTTTSPRDLSTESIFNIESKFIRKSRSKIQPLSRSNSVVSVPNSVSTAQSIRSSTTINHNNEIHHHHQQLPQPQFPPQPQRYRPQYQQRHNSLPVSPQLQQHRGAFYFPNGELFTPRQNPKSRRTPNKINHHQQRPYKLVQSPSLPNLVPNQHTVPPRRNPGGLVRNSMSFQNPIILQQQQQQQQQQLQIPIDFQHEKRPSSSSSSGSSSSAIFQQISTSSSSALSSLNLLNSSSSPSPSNQDDTPLSSISYDNEKLSSLTSDVTNFDKINEETELEEKVVEETKEVPSTIPSTIPSAVSSTIPSAVSSTKPSTISSTPTIKITPTKPKPKLEPIVEKKSFMSKIMRKIFGHSKKKPEVITPKIKPTVKEPELQNELVLPNIEEDNFEINFDEELKDNESVLSFHKNDENINICEKPKKETVVETTAKNNDNDEYMKFDDEVFLRKLIEVGETTFPDLGKPDLGTTRRKSLKLQKKSSLLNRNSTISSQNSNSSLKTFKTSSSYMEDLDRIVINFQSSISNLDQDQNLQIIRNNTLKLPKFNIESPKSALKIEGDEKTKKQVVFANKIFLNDTYSSIEYDRFNFELKKNYQILSFNPNLIKEIRYELNQFKKNMDIHDFSKQNTHFYV